MDGIKKLLNNIETVGITPTMYVFCYLLMKNNMSQLNSLKATIKAHGRKPLTEKEIEALLKRGFLIKQQNNTYICGKPFKSLFIDKYNAAEEFWNVYPSFIEIGGRNVSIKSYSIAKFREQYEKILDGDYKEHQRILDDVIYAKENEFQFSKINTFLDSRQWLVIREKRNEDVVNDGIVDYKPKRKNF
ncbi:MAG: hypothetical protein COA82_03440 [Alkaliphilus sp.]|nr:MAG: hypothetical protein COA82_03440 [Alkaliphilus sp.]